MKRIFSLGLVILVFTMSGCLFPWKKKDPAGPLAKKAPRLYSAKTLSPKLLREAQTIFIVPFTAGQQVESSRELDRLSLMIVKGFTLTLQREAPQLKVLSASEVDEADLIVRGHITQRLQPDRFKKMVMRKRDLTLKVESKIENSQTGRLVLLLEHQRKGRLNQENEEVIAEKIGQDIALYLASQLNLPTPQEIEGPE